MVYSYPYSTTFFMDELGVESIEWDIVRYDEYDSQGTGLDMQAEMADPKWTARMSIRWRYNLDARKVAAKVRKLDGGALSFMVYDPSNPYPAADPKGRIISGLSWLLSSGFWDDAGFWYDDVSWIGTGTSYAVKVNSIGSDNVSMTLKGLPPGYVLTTGDKIQINFGTDGVYFFEVSEDVTANSAGVTTSFEIWPHIPTGIAVDQACILMKPACKMSISPGGFSPGRSKGVTTTGMTLDALEHI